ncbi:hypothetical protein F441_10749 [Phytophthora nicotianae CJ01A1]|uniref:RxLR effector protein n=1 Tax=Phytophthora nicotianae CJ01A1 TaxID=1317063 RepID=W2WVF9_PHYNI|nr:hypothetical protein F441_10749 [Phytophthora nicotianae CJ01A1]
MRVSCLFLLVTTLLIAAPNAVDSINDSVTSRRLRQHPDDEQRTISKFVRNIKDLPANWNRAKAEKLVKRDVSFDTLYKKTKIHPNILYQIMGLQELSNKARLTKTLNPFLIQQLKRHKTYENRWIKENGPLHK